MKRTNIKTEKTLKVQNFQVQLAARKVRTPLSSGFPPSSEVSSDVSSAGQCQSCATEFLNQGSDGR